MVRWPVACPRGGSPFMSVREKVTQFVGFSPTNSRRSVAANDFRDPRVVQPDLFADLSKR